MASASELSKEYVGRTGLARLATGSKAFQVKVVVIDVRQGYGRIDLLVTPVTGEGEAWVRLRNVTLDPAIQA